MKTRYLLPSLFLALLLSGTACGLFGGGEAPPAGPASVNIQINNQSGYNICYVLISPSDATSWGDDRLGREERIEPGQSYTFSNMKGSSHDVMVLTCDDAILHTAWGIVQDTTLTVGGSDKLALTVQNDSETDLCYLYVEPSSSDVWGEDELGTHGVLKPGEVRIFFFPPETYDLLAQDCNQQPLAESYNVALTSDLIWVLSQTPGGGAEGEPFTLRVENRSRREICHAFISTSNARTWGDDRLNDGERIGQNAAREFSLPSGTYDALLLDCNQAVLGTGWNLSSNSTLSVGGGGTLEVEIVNKSTVEICNVLITPSTVDTWGKDLLGIEEVIPAEDGVRCIYVEPGTYDLLAQDCEGEDVVQMFGADLMTHQTWTIVDQ